MPDFSLGAAYVDGQIVPIAEAKISLLDWGFLHSDATYDVAHVWKGKFFRLDDHLERFFSGKDIGLFTRIRTTPSKSIMRDETKKSSTVRFSKSSHRPKL